MAKGYNKGKICKGSFREKFLQTFGKPIEEYESFKRAVEGQSPVTVSNYRRVLPRYFLFLRQDPDSVIKQRKKDMASNDFTENERYERKTKAFIKMLIENDLSVSGYTSRIMGFFANNSKRLSLDLGRLKIPKARKKRKYSPSNEDVRKLLSKADCALHKLLVTFMYHTGAAPVDAASVCCGDIPLEPWTYFERSRSKTGEVWRGVTTPCLCESLKAYLAVRASYSVGEPLFVSREGALDNNSISQIMNRLIKEAGFNIEGFSAKSLRDALEDALVDAEVYPKTKEMIMGHTTDIQHIYGGYKKMQQAMIEAMKKVYPYIRLSDVSYSEGARRFESLSKEDWEKLEFLIDNFDIVQKLVIGLVENKYEVIAKKSQAAERFSASL